MKNVFPLYFAIVSALLFLGCGTSIPERDSTPPEIRFEITIPGHGTEVVTSGEELDFSQINVPENTRCTFRCTASDQGGLRIFQMQYSSFLTISGLASSFETRTLSSLSKMITWTGDRENPTTGAVASGDMQTTSLDNTNQIGDEIRIFASDFGGSSESYNDTRLIFNISIVEEGQTIGKIE